MSEIYNKNAREAHLMAEAYTNVYNEEFNPRRDAPEHSERDPHPAQRAAEALIGAEVMFDGEMGRGVVDEVDVENGVAVVIADDDGGEHIVKLGDFDVVNPVENNEDKDFRDEQKDQDPHRHKGLSDFDAEQRDQDPHRHDEDNEYDSEADAYRAISDKYKAIDSIEVGNIYKGESYHELVVGVKGDEVFTKKITFEDGNRYDGNRMLDEVKPAGKLNVDFLNEVL